MAKIALIDFSIIFRAAWHASEGQEVSAAQEATLATIRKCGEEHDEVAVCIDMPPYLRSEFYPEYKGTREKPSEIMIGQMTQALDRLRADGACVLGAKGYEADDIIATCTAVLRQDHAVTIYSGDKDVLQLVGEGVSVVSTSRWEKYNPATVIDKWGVSPSQMPDLLAIVGDKSDNIPGMAGVGPKTAAKWLQEGESLEGVFKSGVEGRFAEKLSDKKTQATLLTSRELIKLRDDAPIDVGSIFEERKPEPLTQGPTLDEGDGEQDDDSPELIEPQTRAVIIREPESWKRALEPCSIQEAWKLSHHIYNGRLFDQFQSPEAVLSIVLTGRSMGLDAVASLRSFDIVKGKVCPKSQTLVGLVKRSPACKYFHLVSSDYEQATYRTLRVGEPSPTEFSYTINDARAANLLNNHNWQARPKTMLRWRCAAELARAVYPDVLAGLYSDDEMDDVMRSEK